MADASPPGRARGFAIALTAVLVAIAGWPAPMPFSPLWGGYYFGRGVDFSWQVALHLTALHGMQWGRDTLFTYGPLGFLSVPLLISPATSALGVAFVTLVTASLAAVVFIAYARWLPQPLAGLATFFSVVAAGSSIPEAAAFAGLLLVALALGGALGPRATRAAPLVLAGLAAILLLVKTSTGVVLAAVVPLALAGGRGDFVRRAIAAAAVFFVALGAAWLAAGQSPAGFPHWLHGALSVASGYTEAMAIEGPARHWEYLAFALFSLVFWLGLALGADRRAPRPTLALAAILAFAGLVFLKAGFVRHAGSGHSTIVFSFLAIAPLMAPWRGRWRWLGLALAVAGVVMLVVVRGIPAHPLFDVRPRAAELKRDLSTLADAEQRRAIQESSRAKIREMVALPPEILAAVEGRRVHVDPDDVAIAWAFGFEWAPVTVFQSYSAYTPELDRRNADRLADPRGPDRILRYDGRAIDGRSLLWETPQYALARLCRYREVAAAGKWQVLARGENRCGAEREIGVATARPGEPVAVPQPSAPDRIVVARLDATPPLAERLRAALFKPAAPLQAVIGDQRERLVRANLGGPLLMRVPKLSGWWEKFDGALDIRSFAIEGASRPIPVRFSEIQMEPLPAR